MTNTSATTDGDKFEPPYADLDVRRGVDGKPCKPHNKYSFQRDLTYREARPDDDSDQMRPSTSTFLPTSTETQVSAHGHSSRDRRLSTTTRPCGTTSTTTRISTSQYRATSACGTSTVIKAGREGRLDKAQPLYNDQSAAAGTSTSLPRSWLVVTYFCRTGYQVTTF